MRKEWIYGKLICSALFLLGTCLPASAQTGHLSGVRVVNDEIKKNGREVHVNFVLDRGDACEASGERASLSGGGGERGW